MEMDHEKRARQNFLVCREAIASCVRDLTADHAAKGLLQSGPTATRALSSFEIETARALGKSLNEMANQIEHRGSAWNKATQAIERALEDHVSTATVALEKPLRFAGATGDTDAAREVDRRLNAMAERLRAQITEFSEGWTAPKPKLFKDRHPNWDRIIFSLVGAALALAVALVGGLFKLS